MILTILIAFIGFFGLVVIHELGHFITAKRFGVKVEEFGIGYPPRLCGKKFGQTLYSLNLLPLGAFVRVKGETGGVEDYRSFIGKKMWQRMTIILGGVVSFWIVSAILSGIVAGVWGLPTAVADTADNLKNPHVQVIAILPDSLAQASDIKAGDTLVGFEKTAAFQEFIAANRGKEIVLNIQRGKDILEKKMTPDKGGALIGVGLARIAFKAYPWYQAPWQGVLASLSMTGQVVEGWVMGVKNLLGLAELPPGAEMEMVGPLGILNLLREYANLGASYFLSLVSLISVALALTNLLPIPALDGGKMVFLAIEFFKGSPINYKIERNITATCFVLLIILMIFVTFRFDIPRVF